MRSQRTRIRPFRALFVRVMRRQVGQLLGLGVLAVCLAPCGSTSSGAGGSGSAVGASPGGSTDNSGSFVGTASNAALLVQWTRNGSELTGELQQALLTGSGDQEQVSNQSAAFTGTISGPSVTLSLNQGLGSVTNLTGTLNGSEFDLTYPGENGGVITIPMQPGGPSNFNSDLSNLQGQAGQANTQAAQAQAAQQTTNQVASDAQAVSSDVGSLQWSVSNANGTGSVAGDLQQMQKDLGQTQTDLQHVLAEVGQTDSSTLCGDADNVSGDADTVQGDYDTIQGDQDSSGGDASSITSAIQQLQKDQAALDSDRQSNPADVPASAPSDAQVAQAINAAKAKIGGENGTAAVRYRRPKGCSTPLRATRARPSARARPRAARPDTAMLLDRPVLALVCRCAALGAHRRGRVRSAHRRRSHRGRGDASSRALHLSARGVHIQACRPDLRA